MAKKYSDKEIEFIKQNYQVLSKVEIGKKLGRPRSALAHKLNNLGLKRTEEQRRVIMDRANGKYRRKPGCVFTEDEKRKISKGLKKAWFKQSKLAARGVFVGFYKNDKN